MPAVDLRIMTDACPLNCIHCFTGREKRKLTLEQIKSAVDKFKPYKPVGMELEGEGEPTIDPWFFDIINYISDQGIVPNVYTEASTKLRDRDFVRKVKEAGATVSVKVDSFYNPEYENYLVQDKSQTYFKKRNEAVDLLMEEGFNEVNSEGTTRLGFLFVVSRRNLGEIPDVLRYCRKNNINIAFNTILHTGNVLNESFDRSLLVPEIEKEIYREQIRRIDEEEFEFKHPIYSNFATVPCVEYMLVHGDGGVSVCPGNVENVGSILTDSAAELRRKISRRFPDRDPMCFDGHCPFRPKIYESPKINDLSHHPEYSGKK